MSANPSATHPPKPGGWVVSPVFDLLFLANALWPLLLLLALVSPAGFIRDGRLQTEFWVIYFITTPHRWITLFLVAADPDRRENRTPLFLAFAVIAAAVVFGVWAYEGALTCLAVADYVWNCWHFASQHHGVLRMYARKSGGGPDWLERYGLRLFVVYSILRTAAWTTAWIEVDPGGKWWLNALDASMFAVPVAILVTNLRGATAARLPKLLYLTSLLGLYGGLLLSLRNEWTTVMLALTAASSMFHAVEYLAVVSHYAQRRTTVGSVGAFREVANRWVAVLAVYAMVFGLVAVWADGPGGIPRLWIALNLWAAFLHYAYDGFIWKLRKPATATALGVN